MNTMEKDQQPGTTRRDFFVRIGLAGAALSLGCKTAAMGEESAIPGFEKGKPASLNADDLPRDANGNVIPGFGENDSQNRKYEVAGKVKKWEKKTDRKIRVGIAGFGLCQLRESGFSSGPGQQRAAGS